MLINFLLVTVASSKGVLKAELAKHPGKYEESIKSKGLLANIRRKSLSNVYNSVEEFVADVKTFFEKYKNDKVLRNLVIGFKNHVMKDLTEGKKCFSCVYNYYSTDFSKVCKNPHALVWAKFLSEPFWPAKVYLIDEVGKKVTVKFFGGKHETAQIVLNGKNVYLVTGKKYPKYLRKNQKMVPKRQRELDGAMDELKEHLAEIEEQFPNKVLYQKSEELIPFEANYLYLKDDVQAPVASSSGVNPTEYDEDEAESEEEAEPDSKLDKETYKGAAVLESLSKEPYYQPVVVVDDMTVHIILKRSDLLLPHIPIDVITHLQSVTWDPCEYPEPDVKNEDYDRTPGVNVDEIDASHRSLMDKYLSPLSERRARLEKDVKERLWKEIADLRKEILCQRQYTEKQVKSQKKSSQDVMDKETKRIAAERVKFMSSIVPDEDGEIEFPELQELKKRHEEEVRTVKRTPFCSVCHKPAVEDLSDEAHLCSVKCIKKYRITNRD